MEYQQPNRPNRFPASRAQVSPYNIYNMNPRNNFNAQIPNYNQVRLTSRPPFFTTNQHYRYNINAQIVHDPSHPSKPKILKQHQQKLKKVLSTEKLSEVSKDKLDKIEKKTNSCLSKMKRKVKRHPYISGSLLALFCAMMFFNQNHFIRLGINNIMVLDNHGWFTKYGLFTEFAWANPPVYGRVCLYFFAIKNGQDFLKGAKPHLEEVGPFCIYVTRRRRILKWKQKTVKFEESYILKVDQKDSLPLETSWKSINLPIFVVVYTVKNFMENFYLRFLGPIAYNGIVKALRASGEKLIQDVTAHQLFVSYEVKILKHLELFLFRPLRSIGLPLPDDLGLFGFTLQNQSFGITTTISNVWMGPTEMYHSTEEGHLMGDIYKAYNFRKFPLKAPPCNVMKGGEGYFWKRPITDSKLTIFFYFLCRLFVLKKEYKHYFMGSILTRYKVDEDMFNYSGNPENACHCLKKDLRKCDGYFSLSPCIMTAPIGLSFAHFYKSPKLLETVVGLTPNKEDHACWSEWETELGFPVYFNLALQFVLDIGPIWYVPELSKLPEMQFPIVWVKVKEGAIGILGALLFILTNIIHYGNLLWFLLGLTGTGYLFYKAKDWQNVP